MEEENHGGVRFRLLVDHAKRVWRVDELPRQGEDPVLLRAPVEPVRPSRDERVEPIQIDTGRGLPAEERGEPTPTAETRMQVGDRLVADTIGGRGARWSCPEYPARVAAPQKLVKPLRVSGCRDLAFAE